MSGKEDLKNKAQILKDLRVVHQESVDRTQALLKEQGKIEREILKIIKEESMTIPAIASQIELPTHRVLWFVMALKKYDLIREDGMDGGYGLYRKEE
jgi:predicted transcriptional regulator